MTPWITLARLPFSNGGPSKATSESLVWAEFLVGPRMLLAVSTKPGLDA